MLARIYNSITSWVSRHPRLAAVLVVCFIATYSIVLVGAGIAAGAVANERGYYIKLRNTITGFFAELSDHQNPQWIKQITNLHAIEFARVHIGNGLGRGGGLAEVGGNILFASSKGRFGYLDANDQIQPLDLTVPMNLEALRQSPDYEDPLFLITHFRVTDLLAVASDLTHYKLYVAHHHYKPNCMQFKVSSIEIVLGANGAPIVSSSWQDVFVARPNCIRHKDRSWRFAGEVSGGRLARLDADSLLLSIGDHHFDGFNDAWAAAMDPQTDLGKIIKIDLRTRRSRIYASGMRNPQGLTVTREGRVWQTEHGPVGGDEVNLIREGSNYGWPIVTYGMNYGYPSRKWPFNPEQGSHDGYTIPAFVFVPSVGISNIVQPDPVEFPSWSRSLIAASLRGNKLFVLRVEGDRIVYAEPIATFRDRVRDIISLRNGELVYLSDKGDLVFIRNAERHESDPRSFKVSTLAPLSDPLPEERPRRDMAPVARGRLIYLNECANCHSLDGGIGVGPPLNGVVGRRVGSVPGYGYSRALDNYNGAWTRELLTSFLTDPDRDFHGTKMPLAPISYMEVPNVISFLRTTRQGTSQEAKRGNTNSDHARTPKGTSGHVPSARAPHRGR